jgi:hypothetical protein
VRIKGTSLSSFLDFLQVEYGATRAKEFVASLEPALRKRCDGVILASAFYPVEELETLSLLARTHFGGDASFFERSGAHNAQIGLSGVHQPLLVRRTPFDFLKAAERAWGQFVDTGTGSAEIVDDGKARVRIEGWPKSEVLCGRQTGFLNRSLELAGAVASSVSKVHCTRSGHACCEWNLTWDAVASPRPQAYTASIQRPAAI